MLLHQGRRESKLPRTTPLQRRQRFSGIAAADSPAPSQMTSLALVATIASTIPTQVNLFWIFSWKTTHR
ncbi:unnamed protein product [Cuscuta campestris]|uniref:Uncharacterized protein n=1 Tax=Cuscuta campestris TaxID=132261 RepID=A0A484MEX7_9ASTE|nr:unnamed protein product [Cuscuta campestris]VFQ93109.1 unnamed protein product [Cuscuta campestris]